MFRTLGYLEPEASSKACKTCKMIKPWYIQNSLFKHFQGYSGMFKDIDAYSATLTGAQLVGEERLPLSSLKIEKGERCPDLGKKSPDCFWVKFSIQNLVLGVSREKISKMFLCGSLFLVFLTCF